MTRHSHPKKHFYHNDRVICKNLWQKLITLFVISLFSLSITSFAQSQERSHQLSTGTSSGDFYPIGIALKTLLALKGSGKNKITLDVHQSKGVQANLIDLLEGKTDIAFVDASTLLAAFEKKPPFEKYTNVGDLRALASLWPDIAHFIIRQQQVSTSNVGDFRNLIGESVSIGSQTSASAYASRNLFQKIGIYHDKMFRLSNYGTRQSSQAFIEETISGIALFTHEADKSIARVLANSTSNATLLHINDKHLKRLNKTEVPIWQRHIIEANTYPNQPNEIKSIAQTNFLVVRQGFNEQDAYAITSILFENLTFVSALHDAAKKIHRTTSTEEVILPLHPASKRYFMETEECSGIFCLFN